MSTPPDDGRLRAATRALAHYGRAPAPTPDETRARLLLDLSRRPTKPRSRHRAMLLCAAVIAAATTPVWGAPAVAVVRRTIAVIHASPPAVPRLDVRAPRGVNTARFDAPRTDAPGFDAPGSDAPAPPSAEVTAPAASPRPPPLPSGTLNAPLVARHPSRAATRVDVAPSPDAPLGAATLAPAEARSAPAASTASPAPPASAGSVAAAGAQPPTSTGDGAAPTSNATAPAAPDAEQLYRSAHALHFIARDPAAALVAWDAYLRAAPAGRFAVEARYNRALDLIRLGRTAEADQALKPFADGHVGGYRQREATELRAHLAASSR